MVNILFEINMTPFGEQLVWLLKQKKMNQRKLADGLSMQASFLSMILNGQYQKQPKEHLLSEIIKALDLNSNQEADLRRAAQQSKRVIIIPAKVKASSYVLAHEIMTLIEKEDNNRLAQIADLLSK